VAEITPEFKQQLQRAFEELEVGQTFTSRRTFTEADVANFCGVTGDFNPYHLDAAFAAETFFGRRIIPGLLTGSIMTHIGGLLGFLATEMQFEFLAPVYVGDTVTCTVTIAGKNPDLRRVEGEAEYVNQDGVGVMWARFEGFPGNVRLAR
jgi:3-hydroxybutyryl-CoA dehydratase